MAHENPFDQLGLKKEVVRSLLEQGRLDGFLKGYYRTLQLHLHPDTGGDTGLSALVNDAYSQVRRHPEKVRQWLAAMQNGHSEYEAVISALVEKVEAFQRMEREYETLKEEYARVLAGGWKRTEKVRTPERKERSGFDAPAEEAAGDGYDIPPVREPSAAPRRTTRRATGREPSPEPREEPRPRTPPKPITLHDIVLYDAKGKPCRKYDKVTLAGEAIRDSRGDYALKTQDGWIAYYRSGKEKLPSLPLLYAIIEKLHTEKAPAAAGLLKEFKDSWMATSTRIDYAHGTVTHDYGTAPVELRGEIPEGDHWVHEVKSQKKWRHALHALLQPKDVDQAMEILRSFSGIPPYIWTASERKSAPLRAAFVYVDPDRLSLDGDNGLTYDGYSRPVAL